MIGTIHVKNLHTLAARTTFHLPLFLLLAACGGGSSGPPDASGNSGSSTTPALLAPSELTYSYPSTVDLNAAIEPWSPSVSGTVAHYLVTPSLPDGLSIDAANGRISGSPLQTSPSRTYTVRATNAAGSATFALNFSVEQPRLTSDQVDSVSSPYQIHLIYAVPSDGTDGRLDVTGVVERSFLASLNWFKSINTGGQTFRADLLLDGRVDVSYLGLSQDDSYYAEKGPSALNAMATEVVDMLAYNKNKIYLIYYEGGNSKVCGGGLDPGHFSALYLHATPPGDFACGTADFATSATPVAGYWEWSAVHEIIHNLGFVNACAPHYSTYDPNHTGDDPHDLMWGPTDVDDARAWSPAIVDPGQDDYYGASIPSSCSLNLFYSAFLEPSQGDQLPPGF